MLDSFRDPPLRNLFDKSEPESPINSIAGTAPERGFKVAKFQGFEAAASAGRI
jgi:hypothetical protein